MFAKEGTVLIAAAVAVSVVLVLVATQTGSVIRGILWVLAAIITLFTLYFFRDPQRTPPGGAAGLLLAPADGKIVEIVEEEEPL